MDLRCLTAFIQQEEPETLLKFPSLRSQMNYLQSIRQNPSQLNQCMTLGNSLIQAAQNDDTQKLQQILNSKNQTPILCWHINKVLSIAIQNFNINLIQTLIQNKLDLSHPAFKGLLPACTSKYHADLQKFYILTNCLLNGSLNIDDSDNLSSSTSLHIAVLNLNVQAVKFLVQKGASVNAINTNNQMPLNFVEEVQTEDAEIIKEFLIRKGAESKWNRYMDQSKWIQMSGECRICLKQDDQNNLIEPCKCSGSQRFVHKSCLNEWQNSSLKHLLSRPSELNLQNLVTCMVCKEKYNIQQEASKFKYFILSDAVKMLLKKIK